MLNTLNDKKIEAIFALDSQLLKAQDAAQAIESITLENHRLAFLFSSSPSTADAINADDIKAQLADASNAFTALEQKLKVIVFADVKNEEVYAKLASITEAAGFIPLRQDYIASSKDDFKDAHRDMKLNKYIILAKSDKEGNIKSLRKAILDMKKKDFKFVDLDEYLDEGANVSSEEDHRRHRRTTHSYRRRHGRRGEVRRVEDEDKDSSAMPTHFVRVADKDEPRRRRNGGRSRTNRRRLIRDRRRRHRNSADLDKDTQVEPYTGPLPSHFVLTVNKRQAKEKSANDEAAPIEEVPTAGHVGEKSNMLMAKGSADCSKDAEVPVDAANADANLQPPSNGEAAQAKVGNDRGNARSISLFASGVVTLVAMAAITLF